MKKILNKKGFAITSFLYSIFLLAIVFFVLILLLVANSSTNFFKFQKSVKNELDEVSYSTGGINNLYKIVFEEENPVIQKGEDFNFLEGVKLIQYDGEELNNTITYTVSPTFDNNITGKYLITYEATVNGTVVKKNRVLTVQPMPILTYLNELVPYENDIVATTNGQLINLGEYGIRYQGSAPDNYVYFNCSDYNNQTAETCELWRIIGVVDGKVKIVKNESIGQMAWDDPDGIGKSGDEENDWSNSTLNNFLNGQYFNSLVIKNITTRNMMFPSTWYLRGYDTTEGVTKTMAYDLERTNGTILYETPQIDNTNIGLMYTSDWGFAALETSECPSNKDLYNYQPCKDSNWIAQGLAGTNEWLITPALNIEENTGAFFANSSGFVLSYFFGIFYSGEVRPSVYLSFPTAIKDGNGTSLKPFQLTL